MNKCTLNTKDGIVINVEYNNKNYKYSINDNTIDTTDLIEEISKILPDEEITIDNIELEEYINNNEVRIELKELKEFIEDIFISYNKAYQELEIDETYNK